MTDAPPFKRKLLVVLVGGLFVALVLPRALPDAPSPVQAAAPWSPSDDHSKHVGHNDHTHEDGQQSANPNDVTIALSGVQVDMAQGQLSPEISVPLISNVEPIQHALG